MVAHCAAHSALTRCIACQRVAEADAESDRMRHERMVLDDEREALETERQEANAAMQARGCPPNPPSLIYARLAIDDP